MTNQYSAALNIYLQAGAVCSDFFTKVVPSDVYSDQVHHTGPAAVFHFLFNLFMPKGYFILMQKFDLYT